MAKFAEYTRVPVAQSKGNVIATIGKYGGQLEDINEDIPGRVIILFRSNHRPPRYLRVVKANMPLYENQEARRLWRGLHRTIESKFISVADGFELFDQAFMAWIVGSDGLTLYEKAQELKLLPPSNAAE